MNDTITAQAQPMPVTWVRAVGKGFDRPGARVLFHDMYRAGQLMPEVWIAEFPFGGVDEKTTMYQFVDCSASGGGTGTQRRRPMRLTMDEAIGDAMTHFALRELEEDDVERTDFFG